MKRNTIKISQDIDPEPPGELNETGRAVWDETIKLLVDSGILSELDHRLLTLYCHMWQTYLEAVQEISKNGLVLTDEKTCKQYRNPLCSIASDAAGHIQRLAKELGMTPKARQSLKIKPVEKQKSSKAKFFD